MKKLIIAFLFICVNYIAFSQKQIFMGVNATSGILSDITGNIYNVSTFGFSFEKFLLTNIGLETGYYKKSYIFSDMYLNVKYNSIPIFLKYYSSLLNVTGGFNVDFLNEIQTFSPSFNANDLKYFYPILIGVNLRFSKDYQINKKLTLEPELALNYNSNNIGFQYTIGMKLKYQIFEKDY
jgi:hypothetical protein